MSKDSTPETYELILEPEQPDTVLSIKREIPALIEQLLEEKNLEKEQVSIKPEKTFPDSLVVYFLIVFASHVSAEVFVNEILPVIKERYKAIWKKKDKD